MIHHKKTQKNKKIRLKRENKNERGIIIDHSLTFLKLFSIILLNLYSLTISVLNSIVLIINN